MLTVIVWVLAIGACSRESPPHRRHLPDTETSQTSTTSTTSTTNTPTSSTSTTTRIPPNILVVLLDDVGTDQISAYGEHPNPPRTPSISALASQGMLFRNAWAYNVCSPTRAAALTGRYARRTGLNMVVDAQRSGDYELPAEEVTIPELLLEARTPWSRSLVGKWHLATFESPSALLHPQVQGFDWYAATVANLTQTSDEQEGTYFHWERNLNGQLTWQQEYVTTVQVDDALARMALMPEPWFLWLAFNAPHKPFSVPPAELMIRPAEASSPDELLYAVTLEALDLELGRLLAAVDLEDTVVVLAGDNGTPRHAVRPPRDPHECKSTMFEGGLNVPLIVAGPMIEPGTETGALVHLVDLFPTVADLAGIDLGRLQASGRLPPIDGLSWSPLFAEPSAHTRPVVYAEELTPLGFGPYDHDVRAVRDDRFKLVYRVDNGKESLFDLQGRVDDGPDLLGQADELDAAASLALVRLRLQMALFEASFAY